MKQTHTNRMLLWLNQPAAPDLCTPKPWEELTDCFLDCRFEGWDGYGASKVDEETFARAKALLTRLSNSFPAPTAGASPHGTLTLEWIHAANRRLIVSIGTDEQIAYAAILGDESLNGAVRFVSDVPRVVVTLLSRIFFLE